jgi:hypothetical protein
MQTSGIAERNSDDFAFVSKRKFKRIINFRNFRICSPSNRPKCIRIMEKAVLVHF